ncbi:hypothetical protein KKF84_07745 [Myxococcota bacterium]|nr:hypothetical protein [Myxococcota bacterium]MBU1535198.1 hypothetical protein [Myxococcota bacterium]
MKQTTLMILMVFAASGCKTKEIPPSSHSSPSTASAMNSSPAAPMVAAATPPVNPPPVEKPAPAVKSVIKKVEAQLPVMTIPRDVMKKARLYISLGYGRSAFLILKELETSLGTTFEYWELRARAAHIFNSATDVLVAVKKGMPLAKTPREKQSLLLLKGRAQLALRKYGPAKRTLTRALAQFVDDHQTRLTLLEALSHDRQTTLYGKILEEGLKLSPHKGEYLLAQGELLVMKGKTRDAITLFQSLVLRENLPGFVRARALDRAGTLLAARSKSEALKVVSQCRKLFPSYGCVTTEMLIAPPDPRHPNRKIRNVKRSLYKPKK